MAEQPRRVGARARYVHRVTPEDVGQRVSVRHRLAGDGPSVTDVVGRLLVHDGEVLLIIDRHGELHVVDDDSVLASRVLPPHPRRPPEPVVGTTDAPLQRHAARVLLLDASDRVVLVSHLPAPGRAVWTAPGGGLQPGEDHRQAARRELREELGLDLAPGPWIWRRRVTFDFRGLFIDQDERWFLIRDTDGFEPGSAPLSDPAVDRARWWTSDELRTADVELAPARLADHLDDLLLNGPPSTPVDVGR